MVIQTNVNALGEGDRGSAEGAAGGVAAGRHPWPGVPAVPTSMARMTPDAHHPDGSTEALEDALIRIAYYVVGILTRLGAEHDLSLTQLRVLGILRDRRGRMTDLAAYLGLDKSTMSGLVDRAERRGLLARDRNPEDGRVVDVFATPAGRELFERLYREFRTALAPVTGRLSPEQREQLTRLLTPVLDEAEQATIRRMRAR